MAASKKRVYASVTTTKLITTLPTGSYVKLDAGQVAARSSSLLDLGGGEYQAIKELQFKKGETYETTEAPEKGDMELSLEDGDPLDVLTSEQKDRLLTLQGMAESTMTDEEVQELAGLKALLV